MDINWRWLFCFCFLVCLFQAQPVLADKRPNILFLYSDDHAAHAIGAYGGRLANLNPTPTLDKLAAEGVLLTNAFCTNSICTPARATVLTGQYSHVNGVTAFGVLPPAKHALPKLIGEAGYETAVIGKWHLKAEPSAFDYYAVLAGQGSYFNPILRVRGSKPWPDNIIQRTGYNSLHSSDVVRMHTLDWLTKKRDKNKPFFLMCQFKAPHDNFENAERYDFLFDDIDIPEPISLRKRGNHGPIDKPLYGTSVGKRTEWRNMGHHMFVDQTLDNDAYKTESYQRYLKKYLRCVRGVDDNIKRILDSLEKAGELDNTIVIYSSDQGFMLGEHDYIDKRWMYEESLRIPLIVWYPKTYKAGHKIDAIINNTDIAPTLLAMAGIETPEDMQGRSFEPMLKGQATPKGWRDATYYRYYLHMTHHDNPAHLGIRTKDKKLIFFYGLKLDVKGVSRDAKPTEPYWEFYDLAKDPKEMDNRINDPAYAETISKLRKQLKQLREKLGDTDKDFPEVMRRWEQSAEQR
ncbi:MAG: sulfatase [Planctomycetota bacterium]